MSFDFQLSVAAKLGAASSVDEETFKKAVAETLETKLNPISRKERRYEQALIDLQRMFLPSSRLDVKSLLPWNQEVQSKSVEVPELKIEIGEEE